MSGLRSTFGPWRMHLVQEHAWPHKQEEQLLGPGEGTTLSLSSFNTLLEGNLQSPLSMSGLRSSQNNGKFI